MPITVSGASDDLIEIDGDIREEFPYIEHQSTDGGGDLIAVSDGTVLRIEFTRAGVWTIRALTVGTGHVEIQSAPGGDDTATILLPDGPAWVVHGIAYAKTGA